MLSPCGVEEIGGLAQGAVRAAPADERDLGVLGAVPDRQAHLLGARSSLRIRLSICSLRSSDSSVLWPTAVCSSPVVM